MSPLLIIQLELEKRTYKKMAQGVVAVVAVQQLMREWHETSPRGPFYDVYNNYISFPAKYTRLIDDTIVEFKKKGRARIGGTVGVGNNDYIPDLGSHKVYASDSKFSVTWVTFNKRRQDGELFYYCTYSTGSWSTNLFTELIGSIFEADAQIVRHIVLEVSERHHNEILVSLTQVRRQLPWAHQKHAADEILLDWKYRRRPSCVLLCGPSNIGKTELGNELYYRMRIDMGYDDGYVFSNIDLLKLDAEFNYQVGRHASRRSFAIVMVNECEQYFDNAEPARVKRFFDMVSKNDNIICVLTTERQQFPAAWTSRLRAGRVTMIMRMTEDGSCLVMRQYQQGESHPKLVDNTLNKEEVFVDNVPGGS